MADVGNDKAPEEPSHRVESALRALFRELSGGGGGLGRKAEGGRGRYYRHNERFCCDPPYGTGQGAGGTVWLGQNDDAAEAMETILGEM